MACLVVQAEHKWVDNLLSHHGLPGVTRARQGVSRTISIEGLLHILLVRMLTEDLGLAVGRAVGAAASLLEGGAGRIVLGGGLELRVDAARLRRLVEERLAEATEVSVPARRGRPPARD